MSHLEKLPDEITFLIYRYSMNRIPDMLLWEIEQKYARKKMEYFDKHVVDGWLFSRGSRDAELFTNTYVPILRKRNEKFIYVILGDVNAIR